jgi:transposase
MPGPKTARVVSLAPEMRATLAQWVRSPSRSAGLVQRARIVLLAAEAQPLRRIAEQVGVDRNVVRRWVDRFRAQGLAGLADRPRPGRPRTFPPEVALHVVRLACDLPDQVGRSLSQWDCTELARQAERDGVVEQLSPQTVQRILAAQQLKPWRSHYWLHPRGPRDLAFIHQTRAVATLLTRPLAPHEAVFSLDEKTSLQPRPRRHPTRPARPGRPRQVEHEYRRAGALHLFTALNTRSGWVYGRTARRKRQIEYLALLEDLDRQVPPTITVIHLLADNVSVHHGKAVQAWLAAHPRFVAHFTPVHCSWMNPVEQWFSILQRKRLHQAAFADLAELAERLAQFIAEWNAVAHPFRWTPKSFAKILAQAEAALPEAA